MKETEEEKPRSGWEIAGIIVFHLICLILFIPAFLQLGVAILGLAAIPLVILQVIGAIIHCILELFGVAP